MNIDDDPGFENGRPALSVPFEYPNDEDVQPTGVQAPAADLARTILEAALDLPGRADARRAMIGAATVLLTGRPQAEVAERLHLRKATLSRATQHLRTVLAGMASVSSIFMRIKEKRRIG